ncbi:MAG: hypothetical protein WEB88_02105, partial [Gemmatimonadota bacterium]
GAARRIRVGAARHIRIAAALSLLAVAACGDGAPTFDGDPLAPLVDDVYRLTFNIGHDRAPAWLPGGDSVIYLAEGFPGIPAAPGVPLALDMQGGQARVVGQGLYSERPGRWFAAAVPSPDGQRVALMELVSVSSGPSCVPDTPADAGLCSVAYDPRIDSLSLVVAAREGGFGNAALGVDTGNRAVLQDQEGTRLAQFTRPFQERFRSIGTVGTTASWAPDGQRLVVSDGARLLIWTPATGAVQPVPGTAHAVDPAWSPDGQWIAYTRITTRPATVATCTCTQMKSTIGLERTVHEIERTDVALVRPDGSETRLVVADAEEPAWGPDGWLLFRQGGRIRRVERTDGASPRDVPGTLGGERPAVSPDGRWLAFQRANAAGRYDIWLLRLEAP